MAVRAVRPEGINVLAVDILGAIDRPMVQRRNQHHLFLEHRHSVQRRMQHRAVDKRRHQPPGQHAIDHCPGRSGGKVQLDLAVLLVVGSEQGRDTHGCSALQRAQGKRPARLFTGHGQACFLDQAKDAPGVIEEGPACR
ncbi:hypothetical protein D3C76_981080 [compost metagenome]